MANLDSQAVEELLSAVGAHLPEEGESAGIVVVGGSSMALRGWVERITQDVDVIAQAIRERGSGSCCLRIRFRRPLLRLLAGWPGILASLRIG